MPWNPWPTKHKNDEMRKHTAWTILAILITVWAGMIAPVEARRKVPISQREFRLYMGLYLMNSTINVFENGTWETQSATLRRRLSAKPRPGGNRVTIPEGSYKVIGQRTRISKRRIKFSKIFRGTIVNPDTLRYEKVTGSGSFYIKRERRFYIFDPAAKERVKLNIGTVRLIRIRAQGRKA